MDEDFKCLGITPCSSQCDTCTELEKTKHLKANSEDGTPIIDEDGNKTCNCVEPKQSLFPDDQYYCLECWGVWSH